eukprot:TRINITY_DN3048_c1_g1_i1.p2 TRINITY_DN3048_c1_g1~~TRINITY_DN3048_c1_g1_i1.p2  ORF type:complete len:165 (+),score=15.61 TRINITY_DN3048_c1_g1_i1:98-592(+)
MIVPKKDRLAVYNYLLQEGVLVAAKDFGKVKHHLVDVPNLFVVKLMQSLTSRGYVKTQYSWQWYYYVLTDEGLVYLRQFLRVPEDVVPNTHKKTERPQPQRRENEGPRGPRPGRFDGEKKVGPSGEFNPEYRGAGRGSGPRDGAPREGRPFGGRGRSAPVAESS